MEGTEVARGSFIMDFMPVLAVEMKPASLVEGSGAGAAAWKDLPSEPKPAYLDVCCGGG